MKLHLKLNPLDGALYQEVTRNIFEGWTCSVRVSGNEQRQISGGKKSLFMIIFKSTFFYYLFVLSLNSAVSVSDSDLNLSKEQIHHKNVHLSFFFFFFKHKLT